MKSLLVSLALVLCMSLGAVNVVHMKTDTSRYPLMRTHVMLHDLTGEPTARFSKDKISINLAGAETDSLKLQSFDSTGRSLSIMLCVDVSGSLRGAALDAIKRSLLELIAVKRDQDEIAIFSFAGDAKLVSDFSKDINLLQSLTSSIGVGRGNTSLYYGAYKALEQTVKSASYEDKVMILLGDGKDENPVNSFDEQAVIDYAKRSGIPVFTVGFSLVERQYLQTLERISEQTGGLYKYSASGEELSGNLKKLHEHILRSFVLTYYPVGIPGDGSKKLLQFRILAEKGNQGFAEEILLPPGRNAYSRRSKVIYIVLGIIAVLLILAGLWYFLLYKSKKELSVKEPQSLPELKAPSVIPDPSTLKKETIKPQETPLDQRDRTVIIKNEHSSNADKRHKHTCVELEFLYGPDRGKRYTIGLSGATIGRAGDNSIILIDDTVSSHHAKISHNGVNFVLEEVNARNGIVVNGVRVSSVVLESSSTFSFGMTEGTISVS